MGRLPRRRTLLALLGVFAVAHVVGAVAGTYALLFATRVVAALAERGLRIPDAVSVVGFDDIPMARFANPPLTTVYQNTQRAGELLVEALLRQIRDEPVESQMIPASLVVRRSSGVVAVETSEED